MEITVCLRRIWYQFIEKKNIQEDITKIKVKKLFKSIEIFRSLLLIGRGYLPEVFRQISSYLPEVLRQIRSYLPEDLRQIRSYLPEDLRQIRPYLPEPFLSYTVLNGLVQSYLVFRYTVWYYRVFKVLYCCIMVLFSLVLFGCARFCKSWFVLI